jgi:hypothetical protein
LPGPKQKPYPKAILPKTQMPCQEEKLKKERPETDTSAHAWPYDRTGIPITYARKNAAPWLWMYKQWRYPPTNPDHPYSFYANFIDRSKT